jgi:hypothetical protein
MQQRIEEGNYGMNGNITEKFKIVFIFVLFSPLYAYFWKLNVECVSVITYYMIVMSKSPMYFIQVYKKTSDVYSFYSWSVTSVTWNVQQISQ